MAIPFNAHACFYYLWYDNNKSSRIELLKKKSTDAKKKTHYCFTKFHGVLMALCHMQTDISIGIFFFLSP